MAADERIEYTVKVSYMEIYMEKIKDLLARTSAHSSFGPRSERYLRGRPDDGKLMQSSPERQSLHPRGQGERRVRQGFDGRLCRIGR